ncbi:uncharacterized protein LOC132037112 [Lycium ferocissimum]|uniref:uncharacterized protein LOC132037112 n=1 Tax=Lycium ferocissimum TaxID=112874 RepID=UPI002815381F|nr:uncharacterized protein LOC132037112 [Lycium ferocissimum]
MAYLASENCPVCINVDTDLPEIDSAILMSFLDEPQMEYCDDEKLRSLIQSLEAELKYPITIMNNPSALNLDCYDTGSENSSEIVDVDFSWMDMEMSLSTSPSNNEMIDFQFGSDYSQILTCIPIEEEIYDSLWLQTDLAMVDISQ